jgi:U4/U6.U5 tri-snRNP component SNU23
MSTNLNYKQVTNVSRRTWDTETYEKRAKERVKNEENPSKRKSTTNDGPLPPPAADGEVYREEFVPAATGAAGPHMSKRAFLKARTAKVDGLDSKVGSVEIINPDAAATTKAAAKHDGVANKDAAVTKSGVGWHCKVCDCFLRDSHTYLDHINGRKHQRNLGYSMRVERSTKEQLASRLAVLAKEKEKSSSNLDSADPTEGEEDIMYHDMVKAKDEALRQKKEERKRERKERKNKEKEQQRQSLSTDDPSNEAAGDNNDEEEEHDNDEDDGINPDLAAMMGFSGFGGAHKSR